MQQQLYESFSFVPACCFFCFVYGPCSPCSVICFLWAVVEFCFICRFCKYYCLCVSFDKHAATEKYITEQYWIWSSLRSPGVVMPLMLWHATSFWWISLSPQCPPNVKVSSMYVKEWCGWAEMMAFVPLFFSICNPKFHPLSHSAVSTCPHQKLVLWGKNRLNVWMLDPTKGNLFSLIQLETTVFESLAMIWVGPKSTN